MPFDRPTLDELVVRIRADLKTQLGITGAIVRRATANIFATVWAGAAHLLHGHLDYLATQLFADTAERAFLLRMASLYGLTPTAATFASGSLTAGGIDTTIIPSGTIWLRDDGAKFTQTASVEIISTVAVVPVDAVLAGAAGNTETGATMTLETPQTGVNPTATVDSPGLTGGNDEESTDDFRARFLQRLRDPPTGGSEPDYIGWALEVAGVTRVWVFALENGLGTVVIRFVRDNDVTIFPDGAEVAQVQAAIDAERPITADATVVAPTELAQPFTISITPDTAALRTAVEASLDDLLFRQGEPGDGVSRGTLFLSQVYTAIGNTEDITDFSVTVPAADIVPALGVLITRGTMTYV